MKAVIFGAGNIGRGLVGAVLASSGFELTYVDADQSLVDQLAEAKSFTVRSGTSEQVVEIAAVVDAREEDQVAEAVAGADLVATAVGAPVLRIVAPVIGAGLATRGVTSVNVIACENTHPNSSLLRSLVAEATGVDSVTEVGFPDVVVDRIVPGDPGSIDVEVEPSFEFVIDRTGWVGPTPDHTPIVFTDDLDAFKRRKLWLVNGLHALTAWLGLPRGHAHIHEAIADPALTEVLTEAGRAAARSLAASSEAFGESDLEAYRAEVMERFSNSDLPDLLTRVARNPLDKLAVDERVVAPARAAEAEGIDVGAYAAGIVAGLSLEDSMVQGVAELREAIDRVGWRAFVTSHCGIEPSSVLFKEVEVRMNGKTTTGGDTVVVEEIVITNPAGLHARPAAEIVELASGWSAQVKITKGEKVAQANSIMSVLSLGANTGDTVTVEAQGDGAAEAIEGLRQIMLREED